MKTEKNILDSFDGIQPAEAPPYFYTRLLARMQYKQEEQQQSFFLLRPAFLTASLSLFLIINIVFLVQFSKTGNGSPTTQGNKPATIESFSDAYGLNTESVYQ